MRGARALLALAGVRLVVHGERYAPRGNGVLVVANHLSWIDAIALGAVTPVRLLAKCEVREWPVIGALAAAPARCSSTGRVCARARHGRRDGPRAA